RDETIEIRWKAGVFLPVHEATGIIASIEKRTCERVFLDLLQQVTNENQPVSSNSRAGNYAPKLFAQRRPTERYRVKDLELAMQNLFSQSRIINVSYGRKGDERTRIAAVAP